MVRSARFRVAVILLIAAFSLGVLRHFRTSAVHFVPFDAIVGETDQVSGEDTDIRTEPIGDTETSDDSAREVIRTEPIGDTETSDDSAREVRAVVLTSAEKADSERTYEESIREKLKQLSKNCPDLIGWLYVENSNIDYPVVQGNDNQYYLHHGVDGSEDEHGAIFLDKTCGADFSDAQSILYGHNMGYTMFGDIRTFREPAEFERHRSGRLVTMTDSYRIEFFALAIVSAFDTVYDVPADNAQWVDIIRENSICLADAELTDEDKYIALSTCSFDYENARFLFVGKLIDTQESEG